MNYLELLNEIGFSHKVDHNLSNFECDEVFRIGIRKNPKRNFSFINQMMGKYTQVEPSKPIQLAETLANLYKSNIAENTETTLFVGFAEAATGIGHAVFSFFDKNAAYIHTTREIFSDQKPLFSFHEEHSHAKLQHFYFDKERFEPIERIVLVEDEITTGNTAMNFIRACITHTSVRDFSILTVLNWQSEKSKESFARFAKKHDLSIRMFALIDGLVQTSNVSFQREEQIQETSKGAPMIEYLSLDLPLTQWTGQLGLTIENHQILSTQITNFAKKIQAKREFKRTLVLGFGELMYIPNQIALQLQEVKFGSVARNPLYSLDIPNYPIQNAIPFGTVHETPYFLYNVLPHQYDEIIFISEYALDFETAHAIAKNLSGLALKKILFVSFEKEYAYERKN